MSFYLGYYKDQFLNKLGEVKDRAAATLSQLENCDVQLKVISSNTREDNCTMPYCRTKSKCKKYYSRAVGMPCRNRGQKVVYSSDSDTDCDCDDCCTSWRSKGRIPYRNGMIYFDGRNARQQNVQINSCEDDEDSDDCTSGYWIRKQAKIKDSSHHRKRAGLLDKSRQMITGDDGKIEMYDGLKLTKFLVEQAAAHKEAEKIKKEAEEKKRNDAFNLINKMIDQCGYGGGGYEYGRSRSAESIQSELATVNADLDQLREFILLRARGEDEDNHADELNDLVPLCSGALQSDDTKDEYLGKSSLVDAGKVRIARIDQASANIFLC